MSTVFSNDVPAERKRSRICIEASTRRAGPPAERQRSRSAAGVGDATPDFFRWRSRRHQTQPRERLSLLASRRVGKLQVLEKLRLRVLQRPPPSVFRRRWVVGGAGVRIFSVSSPGGAVLVIGLLSLIILPRTDRRPVGVRNFRPYRDNRASRRRADRKKSILLSTPGARYTSRPLCLTTRTRWSIPTW